MLSKKTGALIFLLAAGVLTFFALPKLSGEEGAAPPEPTTGFNVTNESEIFFGKPAFYSITIENYEGESVDYELKVKLGGEEVHDENITLNNSETLNESISFVPDRSGEIKLEFLLYKDNKTYRSKVFQVAPTINYSLAGGLKIKPPLLQNSGMEKNAAWKFTGKDFAGNYTASEWSSENRSYYIRASRGVKKDAFGSIKQNFSSEREGFASLSFDVKSSNASYYLQAVVNGETVWENSTGKDWKRIKLPLLLKRSNELELKVIARNDTGSGTTAWWDNIRFENYSTVIKIENITKVRKAALPYTRQKKGDAIIYKFNTGETLELKVLKGKVDKEDATYTAASRGNSIVFLGETYEKLLPAMASFLLPVIMDVKGKKLKMNESIYLKNGYAVMLKHIDNRSLYLRISRNNIALREAPVKENSSLEYWVEIKEDKKQKSIRIIPGRIGRDEAVLDITQYGDKKTVFAGNKYGEFQVTNVTADTIIMKNIQPVNAETGKEISLIDGKIKIKV